MPDVRQRGWHAVSRVWRANLVTHAWLIVTFDTAGEVSFVGTSVLTNLFFGPVPKGNGRS